MISSSSLSQTQDEIRDRITSHASTLLELFRVTGAFVAADRHGRASLPSAQAWASDEIAFLNANKLQEGRTFNIATLPAIPESLRSHASQSSPPADLGRSFREKSQTKAESSASLSNARSTHAEQDAGHKPKKPRTSISLPTEDWPQPAEQDAAVQTQGRPRDLVEHDASLASPNGPNDRDSAIVLVEEPLPDQASLAKARQQLASTGDLRDHVVADTSSPIEGQQHDGSQGQAPDSPVEDPPVAVESSNKQGRDTSPSEAPATPGAQLIFEEAQSLRKPEILNQNTDSAIRAATPNDENPSKSENSGVTNDPATSSDLRGPSRLSPDIDTADSSFKFEGVSRAPAQGLRTSAFAGIDESLTLSQRPPIRIDAGAPTVDNLKSAADKMASPPKIASNKSTAAPTPQAESPRPGTSSTPVHARRERMTTRVSSGALGRKSVSEILGGPRTAPLPIDKAERSGSMNPKEQGQDHPSRIPSSARFPPHSSSPSAFRFPEIREKDRSKLSTVVFQGNKSAKDQESSDQAHKDQLKHDPTHDDFLLPLFIAQAMAPQTHSLHHLAYTNHKTLSTADSRIDYDEQLNVRLLSKIYNLQNSHRWSLRQHERSQEPSRQLSHWDHLLSQAKWMRTDFREERKWKMAAARAMALNCAEWVTSSAQTRAALQIRTRPSQSTVGLVPNSESTPDLVPSTEDDPSDIEEIESSPQRNIGTIAPAAVFTLPADMFVFGMERSSASDKILSELPLYEPATILRAEDLSEPVDPDRTWKKPIVPLSKHVGGKITYQPRKPPRKKSRYDHGSDDETEKNGNDEIPRSNLAASTTTDDHPVALFDPAHKHIRDRIHMGHAFRPPSSQYPMPTQSFFEHRSPSQWTQNEDDDLRRYVREYTYNWSFISSCLAMSSRCTSGAERRTPWECFERWVLLEGMPAEMAKLPYYRAYTARMQAAQRNYETQLQLQQQQQQQAGNSLLPIRRRSTQPFLVERRKTNKHLHMIDAMRKLAKKRETARAKQDHAAQTSALRRAQEPHQPRSMMQTPQEFSQKKHEKDLFAVEQMRQYRLSVLHNQKIEAARRAQQTAQMNGVPSNAPVNRAPLPPAVNGASPNLSSVLPNGQSSNYARGGGMPAMSRMPNGMSATGGLTNAQGVPHAPMQPHMQMSQRLPSQMTNDMRRYEEAARQQAEQQRYLIQQRNQQPPSNPQPTKLTSPNMGNMNSIPHNPAMYAPMQNGRAGSPTINGTHPSNGSSASPRVGSSQPQPLSSGMVPLVNQMQNQVRNRNPGASPEQIKALTTEAMNSQYRLNPAQQAVLQAAPTNNVAAMVNNGNISAIGSSQQAMTNGPGAGQLSTSQQYAAMVRHQQQQQQQNHQNRNVSTGMGGMRPGSSGGTPNMHGGGPSQSPRPSSAQAVSGQ